MLISEQELKQYVLSINDQQKGSGGWLDPYVSPAEGEINNLLPLWVLGRWKSWLDQRNDGIVLLLKL